MKGIKPYGESALLIQFDDRIDPQINSRVIALSERIRNVPPPGVLTASPSYTSVLVQYDPLVTDIKQVSVHIEDLLSTYSERIQIQINHWRIPVCYDDTFALDKDEVCRITDLKWDEVKRLHTSVKYRVYMLGFLPGFGYMGSIPEPLVVTRKAQPRLKVPARAVGIAGRQTAIYPLSSPGGWQIIGSTPLEVISMHNEDPFLLHPGDEVAFYGIDLKTYNELEEAIASGKMNKTAFHDG